MLNLESVKQSSFSELVDMYTEAFSGHPWNENLPRTEVENRVRTHMSLRGFQGLVGYLEHQSVGASWWNTPTLKELEVEKGAAIAEFASSRRSDYLVYERELLVRPSHQGRGYSLLLRKAFLANLPKGRALVLTRMRDDNIGTLKTAKALGFSVTDIVTPSKKMGTFHRIYYLELNVP